MWRAGVLEDHDSLSDLFFNRLPLLRFWSMRTSLMFTHNTARSTITLAIYETPRFSRQHSDLASIFCH